MISSEHEPELFAFIGGICRSTGSQLWDMNGVSDHVHMLVNLSKTVSLSELMLNVKRDSSKWFHDRGVAFQWQQGYFGFSIGESGVEKLRAYIANQKQHHETVDFKDEVRAFLRKYGIEWDERHVWE